MGLVHRMSPMKIVEAEPTLLALALARTGPYDRPISCGICYLMVNGVGRHLVDPYSNPIHS